jgi:hypothetical protein
MCGTAAKPFQQRWLTTMTKLPYVVNKMAEVPEAQQIEIDLKETSSAKCFGGYVKTFSHNSPILNCTMNFAAIIPPKVVIACRRSMFGWCNGKMAQHM